MVFGIFGTQNRCCQWDSFECLVSGIGWVSPRIRWPRKVPVTVLVDPATKKWSIEIGIPSAAALILKESGIQKGSGTSGKEWVGDIGVDGIVKVAKAKLEKSYADSLKSVAKEIVGTCLCLGIKIEGKSPKEFTAEINAGKWDEKLK